MNNIFCTLFDTNYLDRGITLVKSLNKSTHGNFKIYILPMDSICKNILIKLSLPQAIVIDPSIFFDDKLTKIRLNRGRAEFCWTCTSHLIKYVLTKANENVCTYLDADMFFYKDPGVEIETMIARKKEVLIIPHWFSNKKYDIRLSKQSGKYCVEFNTFLKTEKAIRVLDNWIEQCDECCKFAGDGIYCGDQKYLEEWPNKYDVIDVSTNRGMGIAPWNIWQYRFKKNTIFFKNTIIEPIFYHFQDIEFLSKSLANINVYKNRGYHQKALVDFFYNEYLKKLTESRKLLIKYGVVFNSFENHGRKKHQAGFFIKIKNYLNNRGIIGTLKYLLFSKKDLKHLTIGGGETYD